MIWFAKNWNILVMIRKDYKRGKTMQNGQNLQQKSNKSKANALGRKRASKKLSQRTIKEGGLQMWNQKFIKISQINKRGMDIDRKYGQIKNSIEETGPQNINCSVEDASYFYFKTLTSLSLDILLEENGVILSISKITELKNKIEYMKGKYGIMCAKYAVRKRKEQQKRIIHCEHEDCKVTFIKDKELHYHKLFEHENENLMNDGVFSFRVEEERGE